ncbi:ComF family protein [Palleronia sediminis]|uniref:ComF family protein n=1 Tax=Palleronia sediminis TaxID=2547833 RepID=A0A4R6AAV2_9RHOB|nr:ComF family protein [Palleronia sediminis]
MARDVAKVHDAGFPDHCALCDTLVAGRGQLCPGCWGDVPFVEGVVCRCCGAPLPGDAAQDDGEDVVCDDCLATPRPWARGRAALLYAGRARRLVLSFKHGDRLDLAPVLAGLMRRAVDPLIREGTVLVPVPIHWRRRVARRYNQSAVLAQALGRAAGIDCAPRALRRVRRTAVLDGRSLADRFAMLDGALAPDPRFGAALRGRPAIVIDDVMTSGATLAAATEACAAAGASRIDIAVLARVARRT